MVKVKDADAIWAFTEYVLIRRGHRHIFHSAVQFASWWRHFRACMEELEKGTEEMVVFKVEQTQSFYSRKLDKYLQDPGLERLRHVNAME